MRTRIKSALFVGFLLGLLFVVMTMVATSANAQVCPSWVDPIVCQQEDTRDILRNNRRQHETNLAINSIERGIYRASSYGYAGGYGYPGVGGVGGQPIGRRERNISLGAAVGLGVYGATGSGRAGIASGAGMFGVLTAVDAIRGRRAANSDKPVDCSKRKLNRKEQGICAEFRQQAEAEQQVVAVQAEYEARMRTGLKVYNHTGFPVDVLDGNQLAVTLRRGQTINLPEAREGYRAEMLVPDRSMPGRIERVEADFRLANDRSGWVFTAPDKGGV